MLLVSATAILGYIWSWKDDPLAGRSLKSSNPRFQVIFSELKRSNPDFLRISNNKIEMVSFSGNNHECIFVYPEKSIEYDGNDFLYCSDTTGRMFNRM
jgi:hypothetical protein